MTSLAIHHLYEAGLFSNPLEGIPPVERRRGVIPFELTTGCRRSCTFCHNYAEKLQVKSLQEYKTHVDAVWRELRKKNGSSVWHFKRVYIGGGDALGVEAGTLLPAVGYTLEQFREQTESLSSRVDLYGHTGSILRQGESGLAALAKISPTLVLWGIESGSADVLNYVQKGCTPEETVRAGELLRKTGITASAVIMPGLGGKRFYQDHVERTAEVLNAIKPKYLTLMGINPALNSPYQAIMMREMEEGTNAPLSDKELVQQMRDIIARLNAMDTKIGCHDKYTDDVAHNPLPFGVYNIDSRGERNTLLDRIDWDIERLEERQAWKSKGCKEIFAEKKRLSQKIIRYHDWTMGGFVGGIICAGSGALTLLLSSVSSADQSSSDKLLYTWLSEFAVGITALALGAYYRVKSSDATNTIRILEDLI